MMKMNKSAVLILLISAAFLAQNILAESLPASSYYQGTRYDGPAGDRVRVDFAVYDTQDADGNEFTAAGKSLPWASTERFIYAYQITNEVTSIEDFALEYFSILGIGQDAMAPDDGTPSDYIGSSSDSISDSLKGVEPVFEQLILDEDETDDDGKYYSSASWEFAGDSLIFGEHSFFLILTSDHDYKAGAYTFGAPQSTSVAIPNPEPSTMALFALGSAMLLKRRNNKL